tara:strand:- start:657 stop:779 length:123 start_codon:yes stop_codon:yes gene_type:complete
MKYTYTLEVDGKKVPIKWASIVKKTLKPPKKRSREPTNEA